MQDILIFSRDCQEIAPAVPPFRTNSSPGGTSLVKTNTQHLDFAFAWPLRGPI